MPEKARAKAIGRHDSLYESCAKEEHERENQYSVLPTIKHPPREHKHAIYRVLCVHHPVNLHQCQLDP